MKRSTIQLASIFATLCLLAVIIGCSSLGAPGSPTTQTLTNLGYDAQQTGAIFAGTPLGTILTLAGSTLIGFAGLLVHNYLSNQQASANTTAAAAQGAQAALANTAAEVAVLATTPPANPAVPAAPPKT